MTLSPRLYKALLDTLEAAVAVLAERNVLAQERDEARAVAKMLAGPAKFAPLSVDEADALAKAQAYPDTPVVP